MIDQDLLSHLQYKVIEPPDGGASWPSGIWDRDEILGYLNQRQNRLLKLTLLHLKTTTIAVLATQRRVSLPTDWMRTLTLYWVGNDGQTRELQRSNLFEADHAEAEIWRDASASLPLYYLEYDSENLTVDLGPTPTGAGTLHLLYAPTGTQLTGNGVNLTVPDELETGLLYGVLGDMLGKDGRGQDLTRAQYGQQRFDLTVEVARLILEGFA